MDETMKVEEIRFRPASDEDCNHQFQRLLFIASVPDYGHAIHEAHVKKCFRCGLVLAED